MNVVSALASPDPSGFCKENSPIPTAAQPMAARVRKPMRSLRNTRLSTATTAGMDDITTPAATAVVRLTPNSMQMENRKLPRNDSRNSRPLVRGDSAGSFGGFLSQRHMAMPPIPNRSQASKKTGKTTTRGLDKAT